jgi:hypothetical protein
MNNGKAVVLQQYGIAMEPNGGHRRIQGVQNGTSQDVLAPWTKDVSDILYQRSSYRIHRNGS